MCAGVYVVAHMCLSLKMYGCMCTVLLGRGGGVAGMCVDVHTAFVCASGCMCVLSVRYCVCGTDVYFKMHSFYEKRRWCRFCELLCLQCPTLTKHVPCLLTRQLFLDFDMSL